MLLNSKLSNLNSNFALTLGYLNPALNNSAQWGTPYMKGVGMLVVSLRGVNFGFWSRLGCSWQNTIIFSRKGLF